jgi:3',5'-cyclic AMP phosphodiesterase CpdA
VRRAGAIAFVGLSSAVPTAPFVASGRIGRTQMEATERLLFDLHKEGRFRVVLVHHPPHVGGAKAGRHLTDAPAFEAMIRRAGAELILHGHNHVGSLAWLDSPGGRVPVIGAPSASIRSGALTEGGYHLYAIDRDKTGFFLTAERRGFDHDGRFGTLGMLALKG